MHFSRQARVVARAAAVALAAMTAISSAQAQSAPPTIYEVNVGGATFDPPGPGTFSSTHGSATIATSPLPTLSTNIAVGDTQDQTTAFLRYYFRVNGPENLIIPVMVSGVIQLTASAPDTGQANSYGQIELSTPFSSPSASIEIDRGGSVNGSISELMPTLRASTYTNGWTSITLRAGSGARGSKDGGAMGTAFVDPVVSIDPSFFGNGNNYTAADFSFSFSDGFGNGPADVAGVPEPASWALMIVGFGAAGLALRRRGRPRALVTA